MICGNESCLFYCTSFVNKLLLLLSTTVSEICAKNSNLFYINGAQLSTYLPLGLLVTVCNDVAKVMFLHLSVCPRGGLPQCMLGCHTPPGADTPRSRPPPHGTRLLLRTVRILLECILVNLG